MSAELAARTRGAVADATGARPLPADFALEWRAWRWVGVWRGRCAVFAAPNEHSRRKLQIEGAVLETLQGRMSFRIPRVLLASDRGDIQVRSMVPGVQITELDPDRGMDNPLLSRELARDVGLAYGELHRAINVEEARALGVPARSEFSEIDGVVKRLSDALAGHGQREFLFAAAAKLKELPAGHEFLSFTHGDPWGGNFAVDEQTGRLNGLFDFDETAIDDWHCDLRYLYSFGREFRQHAESAYAEATGNRPSTERTAIYHALSAFLALDRELMRDESIHLDRRTKWVERCVRNLGAEVLGE
ncbi:MAG: aminoglycoside phosphotransferase family protein [Rhodospirillales bacterium]|nr:aminoglycoside phosphotransferase family protein [Rhodospirillales bacterium]